MPIWSVRCQGRVTHTEYAPPVGVRSGVRAESLTQSTPHLWVSGQVSGPSHSHRASSSRGTPHLWVSVARQVSGPSHSHRVRPTCGCQWPVRCQGRVTHTEYAPPVGVRSGVRAESLTQSTPHLWVSGQVSGPSHSHRASSSRRPGYNAHSGHGHRVRPTCGCPVRCQGRVTHTGRPAHGVHPTCGCQWPVRCQGRVTHTGRAAHGARGTTPTQGTG